MHPSETAFLNERLEAIRAEKEPLLKRVKELEAQEERITYALEIIRNVMAEVCAPGSQVELPINSPPDKVAVQSGGARPTLEQTILGVFNDRSGMTSSEVAEAVEMFSATKAKRESILSTLSRMVGKNLVRRDGKLYFLTKKGESPEVSDTSGLSFATTSTVGQHTSSAPFDEEGGNTK